VFFVRCQQSTAEWEASRTLATKEQRIGGVPLCLLGANGKITAGQRLHADTDSEALGIARETVKGHPGLSGFELWEGGCKGGRGERKSGRRAGASVFPSRAR
jgi:hypothetical protein